MFLLIGTFVVWIVLRDRLPKYTALIQATNNDVPSVTVPISTGDPAEGTVSGFDALRGFLYGGRPKG